MRIPKRLWIGLAMILASSLAFPFSVRAWAESVASAVIPWEIEYHDGSGNGYRFWRHSKEESARFQYLPVKPHESSSGIYSGGEERCDSMNKKQEEELWHHVRRLESDASLRATSRIMGTGAFSLNDAGRKGEFLIKDGKDLQDFNRFLLKLKADKK